MMEQLTVPCFTSRRNPYLVVGVALQRVGLLGSSGENREEDTGNVGVAVYLFNIFSKIIITYNYFPI